ncbi:MAG: LysM peptidoglycan-binding protein [Cyanobacteriota bacterium erpe_2018_sw_39hr_WHONDRS-SW48-000098_B_bin.30]|nr:LysM peptidoglycan-binding protein [Cyanobacteriota bacterium erpe_2018_sw_39hr_WHONDRS-SW48-000098_B_bin.30]
MAGTPTDAGDSAKPAAASPPINADTILFRMPTTAAAKPEGQDKPVESAPATDVTTKLQAENPYLNQPAAGSSVEVARINATQTATGNVREQTVQTSDGPQAVKISQQGEKQTVFNNSGQQLYETRVNGQSVYSAVKPEATTRAATPGKPEVATTPPAAARPEPAVVRESGPSAASIQAKAIETAAADTRAVQVRSVTTDSGNNGGNQGKGILASDVPRVVTPPGDARNPVVVENKGQQPETRGLTPQQPETKGQQPETRGLTPQPETRNQGVEPRTVTSPDGKTSDGKSTVTPGSVDAPQVAVKSVNPINPSNPVSPIPGSTAERAVTRNDGTPPQVAAVAERSLAANQPFIAQVKSQEGARDTAIATGTDGRPNPGALQQPGQSPGKPDAQIKGDNPAVTPNPATKPDVSSVTVGNLGGQPIDKGFQNPTGPKPGEVQNPTMPKPGDGQNPTLPKPVEVQNPTLPKPGEVQNPAQPRPGDGQLSAQPPLGQPLKPGDLPPVGQPLVRPGDIVPPGQRPLDGQLPLAQKPVDGALLPGQQGQQKPPEGTPLKPGEVVPGKNALHIDEEIAARLKDLGQTLKPGLPGQEIGKGLPGDLTALNLGKDGKALIPANTLAEGKADLKVDLQALAQNASKPGSGVELNAVLKGLGLEGTKPGDMHGVVNVDAKTLANLDPKAVEALVKAQAEMLGKGPAADATKGLGVELAGAKGDLRGIDLKGLDAAKQVDPLKTLEAGKAQPALTAMELANQLNKPLPVDKVAGASDLTVKPETVKVGVDGLALKPETTIKPEGGLKPEAGVKTEAAGTKVGERLTTATVT